MSSVSEELKKKYGSPQELDYSSVDAYVKSMEKSVAAGKEQSTLDLSPERYGSKADPSEEYLSGEEIMAEAERLEQVKSDAKYIAREIIKELDKREAEKAAAEMVPETIPVETVAVVEIPEPEPVDYTLPIASAAAGFLVGVLLTALFFVVKLNQIRKQSERW